MEDPRPVALLAKLVRAFRARQIELDFDEEDFALVQQLAKEGFVDLATTHVNGSRIMT